MRNNKEYDINECSSRGVCSLSPAIAAMQELIELFIEKSVYYILRLEKLGGNNQNILLEIINSIAALNSINAISENQLYDILQRAYYLLKDLETTYQDFCRSNDVKLKILNLPIEYSPEIGYSKTISVGEKLAKINNAKSSKKMTDILFVIIKSICHNLSALNDLNEFYPEGCEDVLRSLNLFNKTGCKNSDIEEQITKLAVTDNTVRKMLCKKLIENFGIPTLTEVSHSTRAGKAILVSGSRFEDLHKILELAKGENIDVYTHSNLLISHALKKFKKYKNLIGHYGNNSESCILDFGTFPGAIVLTKGERNNSEYFYRGRLFSNDFFTSSGVIKIENNDYQPVLNAAINSKGFSKGKAKAPSLIGFNETDILEKFDEIANNLSSGKIKRLYIVGLNAFSEVQNEYFRKFFEELNCDEYVLSFSAESKKENVLTINVGNYAPFVTYLLSKFFEKCKITENISFIFTACDAMTVSGIIMLRQLGAKSIYMTNCSPNVMNPPVFSTFTAKYGVNVASNAKQDIHNMRLR